MNRNLNCIAITAAFVASSVLADESRDSHADDREKSAPVQRKTPAEWKDLVPGGQFIDLFESMPIQAPLTNDTWGGDNVLPRDVTNGIEDRRWSYWGGNAMLGEDGKYHLMVCRWPEDAPRGHFEYHDSTVVHAVADNSLGPFVVKDTIGKGHNPTLYRTARGKYVIYCVGKFYESKSLAGPWKHNAFDFFKRERWCVQRRVNFTFAPRDDGSFTAISRRGFAWVSPDGVKDWHLVSQDSVYPDVEGIFEDPLIWKDSVQYHLIANDWKGRIAYYMRSKDGIHWKTEPGEAYSPGIARYEDGTVEQWYKYERIRVMQDELGRATQAHFAVIDCDKHSDQPNDQHSSKHICIPLTVGRQIEVLNPEAIVSTTNTLELKIIAEPGFDPIKDVDVDSLRFGASDEVNFGLGSKVGKTETSGADLIVTFDASGHGVTADHFAGKLLGKTSDGKLLFGWARLPGVKFEVPVLSSLSPKFEYSNEGLEAYVEVQNFGQVVSAKSNVKVTVGDADSEELIASGTVRALKPFEKSMVRLVCNRRLPAGSGQRVTVRIESDGLPSETFVKTVTLPGK